MVSLDAVDARHVLTPNPCKDNPYTGRPCGIVLCFIVLKDTVVFFTF